MLEETRLKVSNSLKDNQRRLGTKHSDDTKKKMSDAHKGLPRSDEYRLHISEGQKRRWQQKKTFLEVTTKSEV